MATTVKVHLDSRALAEVLRGPNGPVVRHLTIRATRIQAGARARAGVKTGELRSTIVKRFVTGGAHGAAVWVGSHARHALLHHQGTRPHVIVPRRAKVLVFQSGGRKVFARRVNHPGTKPNPYLTDAARAEGLRVRLTTGIGGAGVVV